MIFTSISSWGDERTINRNYCRAKAGWLKNAVECLKGMNQFTLSGFSDPQIVDIRVIEFSPWERFVARCYGFLSVIFCVWTAELGFNGIMQNSKVGLSLGMLILRLFFNRNGLI